MSKFTTEDDIEAYNLELLDALGYGYTHGKILEPEGAAPERQSFGDVLLKDRLTQALGFCRKLFKVTSKQCQSSCLKRSLQRVLR